MRLRSATLGTLLVLVGCGNGATTPSAADVAEGLPADQIMYDVQHSMTTEGVRRALLYGDTAYMRQTGAEIDIVGVRITFFDENGRESGNLTSLEGNYDWQVGSMTATGEVVLHTRGEDGSERVLETEKLHFDVKGDRLWSDQPVIMRESGREVRGTGFRSDGRFENVTVERARTTGASATGPGVRF